MDDPVSNLAERQPESHPTVTRRGVVRAAVWTAPVVAASVPAPTHAASTPPLAGLFAATFAPAGASVRVYLDYMGADPVPGDTPLMLQVVNGDPNQSLYFDLRQLVGVYSPDGLGVFEVPPGVAFTLVILAQFDIQPGDTLSWVLHMLGTAYQASVSTDDGLIDVYNYNMSGVPVGG